MKRPHIRRTVIDLQEDVLALGAVTLESRGDGIARWEETTQKRTAIISSDFPRKTKSAYLQVPDSSAGENLVTLNLKVLERPLTLAKLTTFGFQWKQASGLEGPWPNVHIAIEGVATIGATTPTLARGQIVGWSPDWVSKVVANYGTWLKYPSSGGIPNTSLDAGVQYRCHFWDDAGNHLGQTEMMDWATLRGHIIEGGTITLVGGVAGTITLPAQVEAVVYHFQLAMDYTDGRSGEVNGAYIGDLELAGQLYDIAT